MRKILAAIALGTLTSMATAQHLWWSATPTQAGATCMYGEVQVVATGPTIYYCGCNWWPGAAAGGYTGIQNQRDGTHNMIFSIWDTDKDLHPDAVWQDDQAATGRFGNEGSGEHTHLNYNWPLGKTYKFFATKKQHGGGADTRCTVFFYDEAQRHWVKEATISSPNNGKESVKTFGGGLNSFLENWSGEQKELPKVALYRLWLGKTPDDLTQILGGIGDGKWGATDNAFYLAEGDDAKLETYLTGTRKGGKDLLQVQPTSLPKSLLKDLNRLWTE